ncbi:HNH endonuclease [Streptomyces sp. SCUT-3]|uniref:HNH endonuclease n=1 Tax=Streptomyces sp. SCUT-3 TaxID=2684469 RepID=UPI0015FBB598|nr:HNH endonuclease [Streptomyces sp. SCUT-3]
MIPLNRPEPGEDLERLLAARTELLAGAGATAASARAAWSGARAVKRHLHSLLESMSPGIVRCMYCGDSQGTDIDHFQPIALAPLRAFDWLNHFLACSHCNSNQKRDRYPCGEDGDCLLVDPGREDPYDHLRLVLTTGEYRARTPKGEVTIEVFGLQRPVLTMGRAHAFVRCKSMLRDWYRLRKADEGREAREVENALRVQPFADVLYAMLRTMHRPGAQAVFTPDVLVALHAMGAAAAGFPAQRSGERAPLTPSPSPPRD